MCVMLEEIPRWRCAQRDWLLSLREFQSRLSALVYSFLFRERAFAGPLQNSMIRVPLRLRATWSRSVGVMTRWMTVFLWRLRTQRSYRLCDWPRPFAAVLFTQRPLLTLAFHPIAVGRQAEMRGHGHIQRGQVLISFLFSTVNGNHQARQGRAIRPSRAMPLLPSLDAPTRRLDKRSPKNEFFPHIASSTQ